MPADVETMVSVREVPWHRIGTIVENTLTAGEALKAAGLDWTVDKEQLFHNGVEVPRKFANVRSSDQAVLGIVGRDYKPFQNEAAFAFFDHLVQDDAAKYETAGSLGMGKNVWLTAKMPEHIQVGGLESEQVNMYLLLSNSHDGSRSITAAVTPIRVVCQNTLNIAIGGAVRKWSVRHTANAETKLAQAREALELTFRYTDEFEETANRLLDTTVTNAQFEKIIEASLTDLSGVTEKALVGIRDKFVGSDNLQNVTGTGWAAVNAVGEYFDWVRPRTDEARVLNTWGGVSMKARDRVAQLILN